MENEEFKVFEAGIKELTAKPYAELKKMVKAVYNLEAVVASRSGTVWILPIGSEHTERCSSCRREVEK